MSGKAVSEILVRGPNWLGDLVMATPGLRSLRAGFPEARITLQIRPGLEALLAGSPYIDRIETLHSYHRGVVALVSEARQWRAGHRFDLGICLPDSFSSALFMKVAGVQKIVGYAQPVRRLLLDEAVEPLRRQEKRDWVAREEHVLGLMRALGCPDLGTELSLPTADEDQIELGRLLEAKGFSMEEYPLVVLAPGASYGSSKRWPISHFAAVGDALAGAGARVLLVGTAEESKLTQAVKHEMKAPALDLGGSLGLSALKAAIGKAQVLIGNDAGCRHIAAAFGVPSLIFFGSTTVEKTPLNLETVQVFERSLSCRPCYKRVCPLPGHPCLTGIPPAAVSEVALQTLARRWPPEVEPRLA
ncbi:MAG: lipopolysaccharide heptosyltransferase II [Myxococcota bacterium]|nr:lipopolysaccharide heptosyltransferase II [Myxococcota bacterium]